MHAYIFDRLEFPCITDENRANPLTLKHLQKWVLLFFGKTK